jgi:microcystin-dependent protein
MTMADFFLGEIQMFGFDFAPKGWVQCNGQLLPIAQNQALFSVLGTVYGGDGIRTFQLPDLRSRLPMGQGDGPGLTSRKAGQITGEENHQLLVTEIPAHTHSVAAISKPDLTKNTDAPGPTEFLAQTTFTGSVGAETPIYVPDPAPTLPLNTAAVGFTGGQPHSNIMPLLAINFCIALEGIFPSRT